jgi:quercetin dioxygenase-like cupin family protein
MLLRGKHEKGRGMKITRFYATEDGESRFDKIEIPIEHARDVDGQTVLSSGGVLSPAVRFVELPEGFRTGWHHAPTRQIVVVLSGVVEVGTSDGHTQQWGAGEAFMPDDLRGKGHTTCTIGGSVRLLYIPLPQDFDLQQWLI